MPPRWSSAANTKSVELTTANTTVGNIAANTQNVWTPGASGGVLDQIVIVPRTTITQIVVQIFLNQSSVLRCVETRLIDVYTWSATSPPPATVIKLDWDLQSTDLVDVNMMAAGASPGTLHITAMGGDY